MQFTSGFDPLLCGVSKNMTYICTVCGYPKLLAPPADYMICPSCSTEFSYDDVATSHEELRQQWLAKGAPWFSASTSKPAGWKPIAQLVEAGFPETDQ